MFLLNYIYRQSILRLIRVWRLEELGEGDGGLGVGALGSVLGQGT